MYVVYGILVPGPGVESIPSQPPLNWKQSPNHWSTGEVPAILIFMKSIGQHHLFAVHYRPLVASAWAQRHSLSNRIREGRWDHSRTKTQFVSSWCSQHKGDSNTQVGTARQEYGWM